MKQVALPSPVQIPLVAFPVAQKKKINQGHSVMDSRICSVWPSTTAFKPQLRCSPFSPWFCIITSPNSPGYFWHGQGSCKVTDPAQQCSHSLAPCGKPRGSVWGNEIFLSFLTPALVITASCSAFKGHHIQVESALKYWFTADVV